MMSLSFLNHYAPIWLMAVLTILFFTAVKALKIQGHNLVLIFLSLLLSFFLVSSDKVVKYLVNYIPIIALLVAVGFCILLMLAIVTKDFANFGKFLAWTGIILAILIALCLAFNSFHTLNHFLPDSSNSGLSPAMVDLKEFLYSQNFKEGLVFVAVISLVGFFLLKK